MSLVEAIQKLNEAQREVVENLKDHLLVMAPAGTGKTNVIALRTAHFIESGMNPNHILCLTFTNKACHELKERIIQTLGSDGRDVCVKTFHSLCYQIIKEEARELGKISNDFMIIDEEDAKFVIKELIHDEMILSDKVFEYIQALKLHRLHLPENKREDISYLIEQFHQSDAAMRLYYQLKNSDRGSYTLAYLSQEGARLYLIYQKHLQEHRLVDFNDLLLYASECLDNEEVLKRWQSKFKVLVVDEVQDTSLIEYQLIQKLAQCSNFSAFGDFNQTIYEWRDSNPILIHSKMMNDFKPTCLELSLNYRATQHLVQMSANYLENGKQARLINATLSPKKIESASQQLGSRPVYFEAPTKKEEMAFIIDHLKHHRADDLAKTVILTRSNRQNTEVSNFLKAEGIPCYLVDQLTLFKQKSVKDLLAIVKYHLNPFDHVALQRLLPIFFPIVDVKQMTSAKFMKRYEAYQMRFIDLFSPNAYRYEEPYGLLKRHFEQGRIVIFDVESTGLDVTKDEIIQIAAIELVNGQMCHSFERFIKPSQPVGDSMHVHGFSDEYLQQYGEEAGFVFEEFLAFIDGGILVGHNVQYDLKIVRSQMQRVGLEFNEEIAYYDTLDIVRRLYPQLKNHKLDTVSTFIGVEHEPTHNAMDDILATKDVLVKSMDALMKNHEQRKKVIAYYQQSLEPIVKQLQELKLAMEQMLPHEFISSLVYEETEHVIELLDYLKRYSDSKEIPIWELWTRLVSQMSLSSSELDKVMKEQNQLAVITVHQAKGLEFEHVIIPFLNQGMFPLDFDGTNQEEECRLFYVAMTRAKQSLLLTRHLKENSHSRHEKDRSKFIDLLYGEIS